VPYRGKRNEPAYVARVAATLADVHQIAAADLVAHTRANFHSLFRP
jgi:TatD DNase family protein